MVLIVMIFLYAEDGTQKGILVVVVVVVAERNDTLHTCSCRHSPQIYRLRFFIYFLINE